METGQWAHWQNVYGTKADDALSWFEEAPARSLEVIEAEVGPEASVIDVGGGASRLPAALLARGHTDITVLDISESALARSQRQMGAMANRINWIAADITDWQPGRKFDLWHDRAVFHFLTDEYQRTTYVAALRAGLADEGTLIMMTFADDGPEKCSGLAVIRYSPDALEAEIERLWPNGLYQTRAERFTHHTPGGSPQRFQMSVFRRRAGA